MHTPSQFGRSSGGVPPWEPPSPAELSDALPAYEVVELLGRGGMGAVYKAVQRSLKRPVAIKVLPPVEADDELKFAERFRHEAETLARLNHPGIVHIHDFGETVDGLLYLVMEFVDGADVHRLIQGSGRLSEDYALAVTAHVCDALAYAHSRGVVHRDIKPANVLIDQEGNVKVADFGLAKMTDPTFASGLTLSNVALGTPDYVAPEVLSYGMAADHRADLYAVGVMLYQMLTGELPRGLFKLPSQKYQEIDPRLDGVICRAMEADRDERYQSAMEVRAALDVILTTALPIPEETNLVPVKRGAKKISAPWLMIGGLAAALAVGGIVMVTMNDKSPHAATMGTPVTSPADDAFLREVAGAGPESQVKLVQEKIEALNGTKVKFTPTFDSFRKVTSLRIDPLSSASVANLSPLAALRDLVVLHIETRGTQDISWMRGMKIDTLKITGGAFTDISVLKDLPLKHLSLLGCIATDFSALAGNPLQSFLIYGNKPIKDLNFIRGMPLDTLRVEKVGVTDWSPLQGLPIIDLTADLEPLREAGILRSLTKLQKFNTNPAEELWAVIGDPTGRSSSMPTSGNIVREVAGSGKVDSGAEKASEPPVITNWQDVTESLREQARTLPGLIVGAETVAHTAEGGPTAVPVSRDGLSNCAIRLTHSGDGQVSLRHASGDLLYVLCQRTKTLFQRYDKYASVPVKLTPDVPHPAGYEHADSHELLVTLQGPLVRAWLDGRFLGEVRDERLAGGVPEIVLSKWGEVMKVEIAELGNNAAGAVWQPLFTKPDDFGADAAKVEIRDGWLFVNTAKTHYAPTDSIDGAIRATLRFHPQHTANLTARANDGAPWGKEAYACSVFIQA